MGVYFSFSVLFVIIIFATVFFLKKRIDNVETKIYSYILIVNIIGLLLEIITFILYKVDFNIDGILYHMLSKMTFLYYVIWSYLYCKYIIYLGSKTKKKITLLEIFTIISVIVILGSNITFNLSKEDIITPSGVSLNITLFTCVIYVLLELIFSFKYRKIIVFKKTIPLYFLILLNILAGILQVYFPTLYLNGYIISIVSIIMYFTIENPDVKLINQLELAKDTAEKANRAKSDFLSSMSHEIRTPLNAIVNLSEMIKSNDNIEEIHEDANDVVMASQNLLEIVDGILNISKIEADKMEIIEKEYNSIELFDEVFKYASVRLGEKEIELVKDYAVDIPNTLYGDSGKVKQIITNLLTNAVKYTEKGKIEFKVQCINEKGYSKLTIIVKDTGRGIKKEQMDKLFTKFSRLEEDMNTTIEGTGLGLAITKSLVEMMGGKIVVDSTYGTGSTFTVFLSQKIVDGNIIEVEKTNNKISYDNLKVLVVDDNNLNLKVAGKMLKEYNIKVETVTNGFDCITKIENNEVFDIIFMDIMMPKMGGVETLKKLKKINNFNIPVIALTADAMEGKSNKYIEVGFNSYVSKPIKKDELEKAINNVLKIKTNTIEENIENNNEEDIHKVLPITDEQIEELNRIVKEQEERRMEVEKNNSKGNIEYLKEHGVDIDSSLELLGDIEMYNETLNTFIEENKTRIPRIEKNKNESNMSDYSIDVHALKSDCKYLGFKKLAELAYDHELKSKNNDINYINEHYNELINEYHKIEDIIKKYI